MGRHCDICETHEAECDNPRVHLSRTEAGKRVVQEMLYGRMVEQRLMDLEKGREAMARECASVMEAGAEREAARAAGAAYAQKQGAAREAKIMRQVCDICWRVREECERPEVHFSRKPEWIEYCNEVLWAMQQEQGKADDAAGRERRVWDVGDRMAEGEGKERAVEEGLRWAQVHAARYEAQAESKKDACPAKPQKKHAKAAALTAALMVSSPQAGAEKDEGRVLGSRAEEEEEFEKGVAALAEAATGLKGGFARMAWEAGDEKGRQAVVWVHGAEGGRSYTVQAAGGGGVQMRVEAAGAEPAEHVDKKSKK